MSDEKKYTVQEIERMRQALRWILTPVNQAFYPDEVNRKIETQLQTYMLNGTRPEELEETMYANLRAQQTEKSPPPG